MQAVAVTPADSFLEAERRALASSLDEVPSDQQRSQGAVDQPQLPAAIDVDFWQEADLSWSAHCETLRVSVNAASESEVIARAAEAIDEFWQILNVRYATLDPQLRVLLDMRHQPVRFSRTE